MKNIYQDFTNLYSLTKTLRFELKPTEETKKLLEKSNNMGLKPVEVDQEIDRLYHEQMKPMFDTLHQKFIEESLAKVVLDETDLNNFYAEYKKFKGFSKDRKKYTKEIDAVTKSLDAIKKRLRKQVCVSYDETAKDWKTKIDLKGEGAKILFDAKILGYLRELYADDETKIEAINKFDKFFTYFSGFNQNRANYYTSEGKVTEVSYRIIDENLVRFLENVEAYEVVRNHLSDFATQYGEYFTLSNYANYLSQSQIDEYNKMVGGENVKEGGIKIQGINEKINFFVQKYNSEHKEIDKEKEKKSQLRLPKMKELYKQIGSAKKSFGIFAIEQGGEWHHLQDFVNNQSEYLVVLQESYKKFFEKWDEYSLEKIYFNKASLNTISSRWFGNWHTLQEKLLETKAFKKDKGEIKVKDIALAQIKEALEALNAEGPESLYRLGYKANPTAYEEKFVSGNMWQTFLNIWELELDQNFEEIDKKVQEFESKKEEKFEKDKHSKWLKEICDSFLGLERIARYNKVKGDESGDVDFYEVVDKYLEESLQVKYYNAFRNLISQKPYSVNKIKLNFENSTLFGGWDLNKEADNSAIVLRHSDGFEVVILKKEYSHCFEQTKNPGLFVKDTSGYQKMRYKLLPGPNKMLPKVAFSKKNIDTFNPSSDIRRIYDSGTFKKENLVEEDLHKMIDFWKTVLFGYEDWKSFGWNLKDSKEYKSIDQFYRDVTEQGYKVSFVDINLSELEAMEIRGQLYRFELYNKDYAKGAKKDHQNKNLETVYFENLFTDDNLTRPCLKLNGEAEMFYRKGQRDKLKKKIDTKGKEVLDAKRYAEGKYLFHFPVTINYVNRNVTKFKDFLNEKLKKTAQDITFLGIDRGEKHLVYYSLIDNEGKILKQGSFNTINGKDYHKLLTERAGNMMEARKNWETIGNIKNFKEGYLSQVVHEISNLVIENNALVILENLNAEFKAKRTAKVEKSVYKKFELALARKFHYLVFKDKQAGEVGGVLKGYQLVPKIDAGKISDFEQAGEWGIIKKVKAAHTSTTDPLTSWYKRMYISNQDSLPNIKKFFEKGNVSIDWDTEKACYKFSYNWEDKLTKTKGKDVLYAFEGLERYRWNPKYENSDKTLGKNDSYNVYELFGKLFEGLDKSYNINDQIKVKETFDWKTLAFYWVLLNQIRNSDRNKEGDKNDFLQSPVYCHKIQGFYDSRKYQEYKDIFGLELPTNGDANGAYHVALRGRQNYMDSIKSKNGIEVKR
jgi:hypothetical protein